MNGLMRVTKLLNEDHVALLVKLCFIRHDAEEAESIVILLSRSVKEFRLLRVRSGYLEHAAPSFWLAVSSK